MRKWVLWMRCWSAMLCVAGATIGAEGAQQSSAGGSRSAVSPERAVVKQYCIACHNDTAKIAGLALDSISSEAVDRHPDVWEKVVRRLRAGQMPPAGMPRPDEATYTAVIASLGVLARQRSSGPSEPGQNRYLPAAQSNRIPKRYPRPAGAGRRRLRAVAGRRIQSWLRQCHGRRPFPYTIRPLHLSGGKDQPPRSRAAQPFSGRRHDSHPSGPHPRGAPRRASARHPRRRGGSLYIPARRGV